MKDFRFARGSYSTFFADYKGFASDDGEDNASEGFDKDDDKGFVNNDAK